jgi:hypothetical protein
MNLRASLALSQFVRQTTAIPTASNLIQDLLQFNDLSMELTEFANQLDNWISQQTETSMESTAAFKKALIQEQGLPNSEMFYSVHSVCIRKD